jgi:hypothetical protein
MEENKYQSLLESSKYAPLDASDTASMTLMLENTEKESEKMVNEGTLSGDVQVFTPILMPMVRRVYPALIANEILGVQPMAMPTGFIYALVNQYTGDADNKISPLMGGNALTASVVKVDDASALEVSGDVVYVEGNMVLINRNDKINGDTITDDAGTPNTATVEAVYTNEASFGKIFKNYTGTYATAAAERLGNDMKEIGFSIARKSVAVDSRALKGQYTVEMYQDLKAQHGLLADEEIMSLMSYEIQAEIDREIVDFANGVAQVLPDTVFTSASDDGTGRWEIEKYRREVIRFASESRQIGLDTKRGQANVILCSPKVVTMMEQVGGFKIATQSSNAKQPVSGGVAGTFDNKYKVIVDQYAVSDYVTMLYKGVDRRDAMGFFAPYVPLSFTKVTQFESGQPAIIAKTRYALDTIPGVSSADSYDRAEKYVRTFGVNFANTILA